MNRCALIVDNGVLNPDPKRCILLDGHAGAHKFEPQPTVPQFDIEDAFDDFMRTVHPTVEQHSVQYRESRRAFVAGAHVTYIHMIEATELPENEAMDELARFRDQILAYFERVVQDKD